MRHFSISISFFSCWYIQNLEEIESLKNEKSPGIVLEFCFPISVQTLAHYSWKLHGKKNYLLKAGVFTLVGNYLRSSKNFKQLILT